MDNKKVKKYCGMCIHFYGEDIDGNGWCSSNNDAITYCGCKSCASFKIEIIEN